MKAAILAIGDELTSGKTVDANSAWLAARLAERGISTVEHRTIGDDTDDIAAALREAAGRAELVIATGGLGPTLDDVSRHGLAQALGVGLRLDEPSLERIEGFFRLRERQMVPGNRVQAMMPEGAEPLPNVLGTAPGIAARLGESRIFLLPGVPYEMQRMFRDSVLPHLPAGEAAIICRVLHAYGTGESDIADTLKDLMRRDAEPKVGITVSSGMISLRVVASGPDATQRADATAGEIRNRLGDLYFGEDDDSLPRVTGELLRQHGRTLATAESCTGGLVGQLVTAEPGSSDYYVGGAVTYSNAMKEQLLGVPAEMLAEHGAVSEPVAGAMASGARERFGSDWALAITGIAGPGGGTDAKPVGLVYTALAGPDGTRVEHRVHSGTREIVRLRSALSALNMLRLGLQGRI